MAYRRNKKKYNPDTCMRDSFLYKELRMALGKYRAKQIVLKLSRKLRIGAKATNNEEEVRLVLDTKLCASFYWGNPLAESVIHRLDCAKIDCIIDKHYSRKRLKRWSGKPYY